VQSASSHISVCMKSGCTHSLELLVLPQAFRVVRRPNGNVIIASDGLSDPFDDISLGGSASR
jgi:hypothetical protein